MNTFIKTNTAVQKAFAILAIFALVAMPLSMVKAAQPQYDITGNTPVILGLNVTWDGDASSSSTAGQVDDHGVCIDWDEDQDDTTHDWVDADDFVLTPGEDSFTATWGGEHTFAGPGTYTVFARVHHASCNGAESSDAITQTTIVIEEEPDTASITVKKNTAGTGNAVTFDFTGDLGAFTVDGDNTDTFASTSVLSGDSYVITESAETAWDFASVSCTGDNWVAGTSNVTVTPDADEAVVCTFVNTLEPVDPAEGTLRVVKEVVGTTTVGVEEFSFQVDGGTPTAFVDGGNDMVVDVDTYDVVEVADAAYTTTYANSLNANANCNDLAVSEDLTTTCTVTNTLIVPGCTDDAAENYNPLANQEDGSCTYDDGREVITICKFDAGNEDAPLAWDVTISNDKVGEDNVTFELTTDSETGCVSQAVYPEDGPFFVIEDGEEDWSQVDVEASFGEVLGTQTEGEEMCRFFQPALQLEDEVFSLVVIDPEYRCDFYNEQDPVDPEALTCEFSTSDASVEDGEEFTLTWNTNNADSVSIDQGIGGVSASGTLETSVNSDTTYTLTATRGEGEGQEEVTCVVDINNESGGGGGGGGGGTRISLDRDGGNDDDEDEDEPTPQVLGESTSVIPAGAPNTGAGGTAPVSITLPTVTAILGAFAKVRKTK